jgi:hypothetical protein
MSTENEVVKQSRNSIRAMVELLRDRRGTLYIGEPSIECLEAFISGWLWALSDRAADMEVWDNFLDFVAKKYKDTEHRSWKSLILFRSANSYEAYRNFFRDFDQSIEGFTSTDRS